MIERPRMSREALHALALRITARPVPTARGFLVLCPGHDDTRPSLHLYLDPSGALHLHCHSPACEGGFARLDAILSTTYGFPRMIRRNAHHPGAQAPPPQRTHAQEADAHTWAGAIALDPSTSNALMRHPVLGAPCAIHHYLGPAPEGDPRRWLGATARYATAGGRTFRPWSAWRQAGETALQCRPPPPPRPLYRLDRLHAAPAHTPIWVLEGERTADAAHRLAPDVATTAWMGGASAWARTRWSPLARRRIVLLPDADPAGWDAARAIAAHLRTLARAVHVLALWVDLPRAPGEPERPRGWDLADLAQHAGARAHLERYRRALAPDHPLAPSPEHPR